jgi:hypothetical protein
MTRVYESLSLRLARDDKEFMEESMRKNRLLGMTIIKNCKKRGEWVELVFAVRVEAAAGPALGRVVGI